jgi:hypothetical protein
VQTQAKSQNGRELEFAQMGPGVPSDLPYGYFPRLTQPLAAGLPAPLGFTSRGSTGPVLVRARTLQAGGGTLGLLPGDGPPGTGGNATVITSAAGDRVRVFTSVEFPAATGPWQLVLAPDKPGCYALQLDGNDFTEVLVADVPGGPANGNAPYLVSAASVARVVAAHAPAGHRILTVAVPADWAAVVSVDGEAYTVSYFSTSGPTRTVTIGEPQPPFLPHPGLVVRPVTYRGDGKASYLAHDSPADTGRRSVLWTEADGSGFLLNATGYTDAQFWRLAAGVS